jgi:hypothetical protein
LSPVLTSAVVHIVTPAGQVAYQRHGRGMHESLSPVGHNEPDLAQIISDDRWRLKHAAAMASGIFAISFEQPAPIGSEHPDIDAAYLFPGLRLKRPRFWPGMPWPMDLPPAYSATYAPKTCPRNLFFRLPESPAAPLRRAA